MLQHLQPTATKPARVVVIGAGGFVGGAIMARLAAAAVPTLALGRANLDLLAPDAAANLAGLLLPSDAVVAVSALAPAKNTAMLADNLVMIRAMVAAFAKTPPAHLVNIGSDAIYGDAMTPMAETAPTAPESSHGVMHLAREVAFRSEVAAPTAFLRPTLIYGRQDPHNGYGPNRFRRLAAKGEEIVLFGDGEERRDHVLVDDVAEIACRALLHRSTGTLTVATGQVHAFRWIADTIAAMASPPVAVRGTPRKGAMPHNGYRAFDVSASAAAFPDFAYVQLPEGLRRIGLG
jgi:nucleoside-diphosphate-sugar epimerase